MAPFPGWPRAIPFAFLLTSASFHANLSRLYAAGYENHGCSSNAGYGGLQPPGLRGFVAGVGTG